MQILHSRFFGGLGVAAMLVITVGAARAETPEVKEKPRMYTYFSNWEIPRARWSEVDKANLLEQKALDQAVAAGTLLGYGDDSTIVHQADGPTHDDWFSASSMSALLEVLDKLTKTPDAPVYLAVTKHSDAIYVSQFYSWRAGTYKGAYTHTSFYKLKASAPDDAVESISKSFIVPLMEKLLADGSIVEYEVDTEAVHTESLDEFWVSYICPNATGLDKVNAALGAALKGTPMTAPALDSMMDMGPHRDYLLRSNATYK